jgi:MFS family permease
MNSSRVRRMIAAGLIGNVLEWYDFAIYGYFATAIGRHFFPHEDAVAQLLSAFGVFALGYLMRPVGGVVIGHIGDRFGRRAALTFSVAAMAIPTFLIGLLPGYATLGLLAPIALTFLRMVQGLSVGGEYTSSMVFLVEHAPDGRRGLMGALASVGATGGILLGSAVGAGFAASMSDATLEAWGWRIPFLLGLVVGIAGYFLRRHVLDTVPTERRKHGGGARLQHQPRGHRRLDAAGRDLAGRSHRRGDRAGVHDHGRGRRDLRDAAVVSRDLSHPVHRRKFRRGRGLRVTRAAAEDARSVHAVKAARRLRAA